MYGWMWTSLTFTQKIPITLISEELVPSAVNPLLLQEYCTTAPKKNRSSVHDWLDKGPSSLQALSYRSLVCLTTTT